MPFWLTHLLLHAPQLLASLPMATSQPSTGLMLQSAQPASHTATLQLPVPQSPTACASVHSLPQAPQLLLELSEFSQPFRMSPSQSPKVGRQAMAQAPLAQLGVPWLVEQALPQAPQLSTSVAMAISQPSASLSSLQSAKPASQLPVQRPAVHSGWAMFLLEHARPQPPQCATLVSLLISQPSTTLRLQSAHGARQVATAQAPLTQPGWALGTLHAKPQLPQWLTLTSVLVSQPSATLPLHSPKPGLHEPTAQAPFWHAATPLGALHTLPQAPQFFGAAASTAQAPAQHAPPGPHAMPQALQLSGSCSRSEQAPPQHVSPMRHGR